MRKHIIVLTMIFITTNCSFGQKVTVGLQGGLNLNNLGLTNDSFPITHSLFGYQGGVFTRIHILKYFVQTEASFMKQRNNVIFNDKISGNILSDYISANYIMLGCIIGYKIGVLRLSGGMYVTKQLSQQFELNSHQSFILSTDYSSNMRAGVQGGVGLKIANKWNIDFRAMVALTKSQYQVTIDQSEYQLNGLAKNLTVTLGYNIFTF